MVMHNPPHPGEVIRELCIEPLGLSATEAAKGLGVSRKTLSALLNARFGISPEMAIRLSRAFGGSAESWLIQQTQYDFWTNVFCMNVSLTPELEQYIRTKVDSGRYLSASEVVREALRLLEQKEKRLEELRVEIQKGLDSGRSELLNMEAIKAKARNRLSEES